MRDWRAADQLKKTEVAYRLTEQMIMRGNAPRARTSAVDLYVCMDQAYTPEADTVPVREVAAGCAVLMGWRR